MDLNREKFIDLSARLPYGVRGTVPVEVATGDYDVYDGSMLYDEKEILVELLGIGDGGEIEVLILEDGWEDYDLSDYDFTLDDFTPYLRPMESMTEEEYKEYDRLIRMSVTVAIPPGASIMKPEYIIDLEDDGDGLNHLYDWLNEHHFDYRGLIPKELATAVTNENNPYKEV